MINEKLALISGARGQDASLLSKLLLDKGWKVVAFERYTQTPDYTNIKDILNHPNYILEKADVTDAGSVSRLVNEYKPEHFYHLAAASFVHTSWNEPAAVLQTNALGTLNCLESIRVSSPKTRFLFASTSETVGNSKEPVQNEETPHSPHSPYAAAKVYGEHLCYIYKLSHKLHVCFTRCYNHESPLRGKQFVTRKITDWIGRSVAKTTQFIENKVIPSLDRSLVVSMEDGMLMALEAGEIQKLSLGNLNSSRDWLHAKDCVRGMHMVLSHDTPDNFVLASGKMHSIDYLLKVAFNHIGVKDYMKFIRQDPKFMRPDDVVTLCGDYSKAKRILGWEPEYTFEYMVKEMVDNDVRINSL